MSKTVQELLKPRYKVIADYPGNVFKLNSVIDSNAIYEGCPWSAFMYRTQNQPEKYPHLFKKLKWQEERTEDEMPEYVSYVSLTKLENIYGDVDSSPDNFEKARVYIKVDSWQQTKEGWQYNGTWLNYLGLLSLPATKEDYDNYIKTKQP